MSENRKHLVYVPVTSTTNTNPTNASNTSNTNSITNSDMLLSSPHPKLDPPPPEPDSEVIEIVSLAMEKNFLSKRSAEMKEARSVAFERVCKSRFLDERRHEYKGEIEFIQFGSSTFGLDGDNSDLDVCIKPAKGVFPPKFSAKAILSRFKPHRRLKFKKKIFSARVPLIQLETIFGFQKVEVDLSVVTPEMEAEQLKKGPFIAEICGKDEANRIAVFLFTVKHWAKAFEICDASNGTINSYTWMILALFCLKKEWGENYEIPANIRLGDMLTLFFDTLLDFNAKTQVIDLNTANFRDKAGKETSQLFVVCGVFETDKRLGRSLLPRCLETVMRSIFASSEWMHKIAISDVFGGGAGRSIDFTLRQIFDLIYFYPCLPKGSIEKMSLGELDGLRVEVTPQEVDWSSKLDGMINN